MPRLLSRLRSVTAGLPRSAAFIIGNEACERFSFYGMRNILTVFLIDYLLKTQVPDDSARTGLAKAHFHLFVSAVYFLPLAGGLLADRWLGKYRTIFWLSLVYCLGHACLAAFDTNPTGFYVGLGLIAVGSGGIKPCVSAMVGDQFTDANKHLVKQVFAAFYWSINFGSFFASLLIPKTLKIYGPAVAFGIPGVLMFIATFIFWLGRKSYVNVPPVAANPHSFTRVVLSAVRLRNHERRGLDAALAEHPAEAVEGARAVVRMLLVFTPIPFFWMLFDQKASTWVVQAKAMNLQVGPFTFEPSQMQLVNPMLVMLLIPLVTGAVYPLSKRLGYELTPLRRMTIGLALGALSYLVAGAIQMAMEQRGPAAPLSILWQLGPYLILTTGEILVSTTGLEFAYTQAPRAMKSTLMSLWSLNVTVGNLLVAAVSALNVFTGVGQFFFWAALAFMASIALGLIARGYRPVEYFQPG